MAGFRQAFDAILLRTNPRPGPVKGTPHGPSRGGLDSFLTRGFDGSHSGHRLRRRLPRGGMGVTHAVRIAVPGDADLGGALAVGETAGAFRRGCGRGSSDPRLRRRRGAPTGVAPPATAGPACRGAGNTAVAAFVGPFPLSRPQALPGPFAGPCGPVVAAPGAAGAGSRFGSTFTRTDAARLRRSAGPCCFGVETRFGPASQPAPASDLPPRHPGPSFIRFKRSGRPSRCPLRCAFSCTGDGGGRL